MRPVEISEELKLLFAKCILANELGGQLSLIYKFSDADGVRTGKSGWSWGIVQYDVSNNPNAIHALRDIGFTTDEIASLKSQDPLTDMEVMNAKLFSNKATVDMWDRIQLDECISVAQARVMDTNAELFDKYVLLHIADYANQFGMSRGGKLHSWLKDRIEPVTAEEIRDFKIMLPWGFKRPDDVMRRYGNIIRLTRQSIEGV